MNMQSACHTFALYLVIKPPSCHKIFCLSSSIVMLHQSFLTSRRTFLLSLCATGIPVIAVPETKTRDPYIDSTWRAITKSEWRERLSPKAFRVLREEGTERSFTSPLNDEKRKGIFHCAGCDLALFDSKTKYDSGTGWPSFYDVIKGAVNTKPDYKFFMRRTEYHCARCLGHQGHVFEDGPRPTGLRYCNNGVALTFKPNVT